MRTVIKCCWMYADFQFSVKAVSNYCLLLCLGLVFVTSSWFTQSASAQTPSGALKLVGPTIDPGPNEDFVVSVEILNPQNVSVFRIVINTLMFLAILRNRESNPGKGSLILQI